MVGKVQNQYQQWDTLRRIAETLNQSEDVRPLLQMVLKELLQVTGLSTGWIFLVEDEPEYTTVAMHHLPPALTTDQARPMCQGRCWCLDRVWDGRLHKAVNIMGCQRLDDAVKYQWGDTWGITHHATVPLMAGGEVIGLLNVASPGKENFTNEELALLQGVAYQIGTAVKKTWLVEAQQRRAERFSQLDEVSRAIWSFRSEDDLLEQVVHLVATSFNWPLIALWTGQGKQLKLHTFSLDRKVTQPENQSPTESLGAVGKSFLQQEAILSTDELQGISSLWPDCSVVAAAPLSMRGESFGVIVIGSDHPRNLDISDLDVLKALGEHLSLAIESGRLEEERERLLISEERNRLARDLHDSVNQKLFSLSLNARTAKGVAPKENEMLHEALEDMEMLSREALKEMRSLIWQLRPAGLENGVVSALHRYGTRLGLTLEIVVEGVVSLSRNVEETLWRIGQEALNNVSRHADTDQVYLYLSVRDEKICLQIKDNGRGCVNPIGEPKRGLGIIGMKERAQLINGSFRFDSETGLGTIVEVSLPYTEGKEEDDEISTCG
ncbi:GAF domain-containing sensor histidine kinase [Marininema halotolerans]|nr:GAF domain-containing sensor histidine kinase [Marininema halotolerans]